MISADVYKRQVLQVLDPLLDLLGLGQVVPKAVGGRLSLEHIQLALGPIQIKGLSQLCLLYTSPQ